MHSFNPDNSSARWVPRHRPYFTDAGPGLEMLLALLVLLVVRVPLMVLASLVLAGSWYQLLPWASPTHTRCQGLEGAAVWLHVRPHPVLVCLPLQGFWKSPVLPGERWRRGRPASGRCGPGTPCPSRCARLQLAPPPGPFFSPFCVRALLICEQGPFMQRRPHQAPPQPSPTLGRGFPFHLALGAPLRARRQEGLVVSQNRVTQLSVGHCGPAALIF